MVVFIACWSVLQGWLLPHKGRIQHPAQRSQEDGVERKLSQGFKNVTNSLTIHSSE